VWGVRRERRASCMAELKVVEEALFGKPKRQGHLRDLRVHGKILLRPVERNKLYECILFSLTSEWVQCHVL
jgi:hypothetical protein